MWDFSLFSLIGSSALQLTANNGAFACLLTGIVRLLKTSLSGFIIWVSPCSDCERMPGECDSVCSSELRLPRVVFWPSAHNKHSGWWPLLAMSVYKQSSACRSQPRDKAGLRLSIEMVSSSAASMEWRSHSSANCHFYHIPPPARASLRQHLLSYHVRKDTGTLRNNMFELNKLNSVKIFQNYVNLAEVRTSHPLTGLHCAGSRNRLICVSNGFLGWLVTPWPHMSISSLVALTLSSDISQPSLTFLCSSRVCPRMFGHQWLLHQARRMQVSIKMFHDK